jgi:hypothetical protein
MGDVGLILIKICILLASGINISHSKESLSAAPVLSCRYKLLHNTNTIIRNANSKPEIRAAFVKKKRVKLISGAFQHYVYLLF